MLDALKRRREALLDRYPDAANWRSRLFSGTTYSLWRAVVRASPFACRGLVLDAGAGRQGWRRTVLATAAGYESIDIAPRGPDAPTWIGDLTAMPQVPDARYDGVICHQVLEHVRRPWRALAEIHRVLRPGGSLLLSVPHLSRRHELPHDYFRFTQEGVGELLADAGFADLRVEAYGGVCSFLHHQASLVVPGMIAGVPMLGTAAMLANAPLSWMAVALDELVDRQRLLPTGVLAMAKKPD